MSGILLSEVRTMEVMHSCHVYLSGMTCIQCQNQIRNALQSAEGISQVQVSYQKADALFVYDSTRISYQEIVAIIRNAGYDVRRTKQNVPMKKMLICITAIGILSALLAYSGLLNLLVPSQTADSGMGYGTLFITGLLTSVHCVAMCGGIHLSQTLPRDGKKVSFRPAILYNAGRVLSYTLTGLILGIIGYFIGGVSGTEISSVIQGIFKLIMGILLVMMGIQMLDIFPNLKKYSFPMPKFLIRILGKTSAKSKTLLMIGFLNGFVPCGPLQAMWIVALAGGSPFKGMFSMLAFSLGTVPLMLGLGIFITTIGKKFTDAVRNAGAVVVTVMGIAMLEQGSHLSGIIPESVIYAFLTGLALLAMSLSIPFRRQFMKYAVSAVCILLTAGGFWLTEHVSGMRTAENNAKIIDGVQVIYSKLTAGTYPEITVQNGMPVRWIIQADADSINGCNQTIISKEFSLNYTFQEGDNLIEFTPVQSGDYLYTCWMGMITGTIHVTEKG